MKYFLTLFFLLGFNLWAQVEVPKKYSKAMVLTDINLIGLKWEDLGILDSNKFPNALLNSWVKWLADKNSSEIQEFSLCEGQCAKEFSQWQQLSIEEAIKSAETLPRDLWITISYNLRKKNYIPDIKEWQFEWNGRVVVLDSATKKVLYSFEMDEQNKTWTGLDQKALNSALATGLYRTPLNAFDEIIKKAPELLKLTRANRFIVSGYQNLEDVLSLLELVKKVAAPANFEVKLELFGQKEAQILCFYQAEEKSFTDLLSRLKELKSSKRFRIDHENNGVLPVLKLIAE